MKKSSPLSEIFHASNFVINRRFDLITPIVFLLIVNSLYLPNIYFPKRDALFVFQEFYYFYNNLFFNGELARWIPYYAYGLPSNYDQIDSLTPVSYLAFLIGWVFKIKDVLFLFKLSLLGEQLVLLTGMYLLSWRLFSNRLTVFVVCLGVLGSTYWLDLIYFHFRFFYLFPLATYFFLNFFATKRPEFFWLGAMTMLAWFMGVPSYFIFLWIFIFFIIFLWMIISDKEILRPLFKPSVTNVLLFLIVLAIGLCIYYHLQSFYQFIQITNRQRGLKTGLGAFLTYGAQPDTKDHFVIGQYLRSFMLGNISQAYLGLLLLAFWLLALLKERSKIFFVFLSATIALIWLSSSGIFSVLCYYFFPLMPYYRHIDPLYFCGFIKILILICAGFGCEYFWQGKLKTKAYLILAAVVIFVFVLDNSKVTSDALVALWYSEDHFGDLVKQATDPTSVLFRMNIYLAVIALMIALAAGGYILKKMRRIPILNNTLSRAINGLLIFAFLIDIFSFQYFVYKNTATVLPSYRKYLYTTRVHELTYQEQRAIDPIVFEPSARLKEESFEKPVNVLPLTIRQRDAFKLTAGIKFDWHNNVVLSYNFWQFDPCRAQFKTDNPSWRVPVLLNESREGTTPQLTARTEELYKVIGCRSPKLRLISQAVPADTVEEAREKVYTLAKSNDVVVLRGTKELATNPTLRKWSPDLHGKISVTKFTHNEIKADVDVREPDGVWLVYADSYHPGWMAFVNGKKVPIYEANVAFKAIHLERGHSGVRLIFNNGFGFVTSHVIALFGLMMAISFFTILAWILFFHTDPFFILFKKT